MTECTTDWMLNSGNQAAAKETVNFLDERMNGLTNDWMIDWTNAQFRYPRAAKETISLAEERFLEEWMNKWTNERMNEWTNDQMIEWSNDRMLNSGIHAAAKETISLAEERFVEEGMNRWTNEIMNEWSNERMLNSGIHGQPRKLSVWQRNVS